MAEEQVEKSERKAREVLNDFGGTGDENKSFFHKFGGFEKGDNAATKVIKDLQGLPAFMEGWQKACENGSKLPVMEEMNGLFYLFGYFIKYLYQEGIPEWKEDETYFKDSIVKHGGYIYKAVYAETVTETIDGEDVKTAVGFSGIEKKPGEAGTEDYWSELSFKNLVAERLTAGSATINGALSAQSANIDGALTANSLNATTDLTVGNDITATNEISTKDLTVSNSLDTKSLEADSAKITGTGVPNGSDSLNVTGKTNMTGDLVLTGNANLGSLDVKGYTNINGTLTAKGAVNLGDTSNNIFLKGKVYMANGGYPCIDIDNSSTNNMDKGVWIGKIKPTRSSATGTITPGYLSVDASGFVSTSTINTTVTKHYDLSNNVRSITYNKDGVATPEWEIERKHLMVVRFVFPDGKFCKIATISCKLKKINKAIFISPTQTAILFVEAGNILPSGTPFGATKIDGVGYLRRDNSYTAEVSVQNNTVYISSDNGSFEVPEDTYLSFNITVTSLN